MLEEHRLHDKSYIELRDMFDNLLEKYDYDSIGKLLDTLDYDKLCFRNMIYIILVTYRFRVEIPLQYGMTEYQFKQICKRRGIDPSVIFSRMVDND